MKKLDPQGKKSDPNLHQAMYEVPDASVPAGTVVQVLQSGFTIGDRILRPALVGVSKGGRKLRRAKPQRGRRRLKRRGLFRPDAVTDGTEFRKGLAQASLLATPRRAQERTVSEPHPLHHLDIGAGFGVLAPLIRPDLVSLHGIQPDDIR